MTLMEHPALALAIVALLIYAMHRARLMPACPICAGKVLLGLSLLRSYRRKMERMCAAGALDRDELYRSVMARLDSLLADPDSRTKEFVEQLMRDIHGIFSRARQAA